MKNNIVLKVIGWVTVPYVMIGILVGKKKGKKYGIAAGILSFFVIMALGNINTNAKKIDQRDRVVEKTISLKTAEPKQESVPVKTVKVKTPQEEYDEWVKSKFSVWDGSCKSLKELTINNLNDPDSFKHISTKYWTQEDMKSIIVVMEFTAKNAFGGTIRSYSKGTLNRDSNTIVNFEIN